jgi:hypothetical protein
MALRDIDRGSKRIEAALTHGLGIPKHTVLEYETALTSRWPLPWRGQGNAISPLGAPVVLVGQCHRGLKRGTRKATVSTR